MCHTQEYLAYKERAFVAIDQGTSGREIITYVQRRSPILAAIDLKMFAWWKNI